MEGRIGTAAHQRRGNNAPSSCLGCCNPKPPCWKPPNPYTEGGDEHGKERATAATAFTFSTVTVTFNTGSTGDGSSVLKNSLPAEMNQFRIGYRPKLLIEQIFMELYSSKALFQCHQWKILLVGVVFVASGTKWPIHIPGVVDDMSAGLYNLSHLFFHICSHSCVSGFHGCTHNQGLKPVRFVFKPPFTLRYGDIVCQPQDSQ